jgi:hypothetical protein
MSTLDQIHIQINAAEYKNGNYCLFILLILL